MRAVAVAVTTTVFLSYAPRLSVNDTARKEAIKERNYRNLEI
jgi:hypothetical protein